MNYLEFNCGIGSHKYQAMLYVMQKYLGYSFKLIREYKQTMPQETNIEETLIINSGNNNVGQIFFLQMPFIYIKAILDENKNNVIDYFTLYEDCGTLELKTQFDLTNGDKNLTVIYDVVYAPFYAQSTKGFPNIYMFPLYTIDGIRPSNIDLGFIIVDTYKGDNFFNLGKNIIDDIKGFPAIKFYNKNIGNIEKVRFYYNYSFFGVISDFYNSENNDYFNSYLFFITPEKYDKNNMENFLLYNWLVIYSDFILSTDYSMVGKNTYPLGIQFTYNNSLYNMQDEIINKTFQNLNFIKWTNLQDVILYPNQNTNIIVQGNYVNNISFIETFKYPLYIEKDNIIYKIPYFYLVSDNYTLTSNDLYVIDNDKDYNTYHSNFSLKYNLLLTGRI